jgi:hypothetical protein
MAVMKTRWIVVLTCISLPAFVPFRVAYSADEPTERSYAVNLINENLRKDAHAVVRDDITIIDIRDRRNGTIKRKRAVTIFDSKGREYGQFGESYDKFWKLWDLDGVILDQDGNEIRTLKKDDTHDFSGGSSYSLYEDWRVRTAELLYDHYPYTVVFTSEIVLNGILGWPSWIGQDDETALEYSRYEVTLPEGEKLRYWTNSDTVQPQVTQKDGRPTYVWEARNLKKLTDAEQQEELDKRTIVVQSAPALFEMEGYEGDMREWRSLGNWMAKLYHGRDALPDSLRKEIHTLVDSIKTPREKATMLYRYLQNKTRYVSIQIGIGGWQPFDASFVYQHGYGDCKALSNYMASLLKEAGIPAYPVLIKAGRWSDPLYHEDFPSNQFNHVIVCVPMERDSLWLECTSSRHPAGHLGAFTENRFALLLTSQGGEIVHTPSSRASENVRARTAHFVLSFTGRAEGTVTTLETGNYQDEVRSALADASPEDRTKWLLNDLNVSNAEVRDLVLRGFDEPGLDVAFSFDMRVPRYASVSNERIFLPLNLAEKITIIPKDVKERRSPVRYDYPSIKIDSITYSLPPEFKVESLPAEVNLNASFASYDAKTVRSGDSALTYIRRREIRERVVPPAMYQEYRKFWAEIVKADRAQAVLIRKEK